MPEPAKQQFLVHFGVYYCLQCTAQMTTSPLSSLTKWSLERDDESDPNGRIYRNSSGEIFHSVTRILKETSASKAHLEAWMERLGVERATQERDVAAERGTRTHNAAEYVLRTAKKISEATAKKKGNLYVDKYNLECVPAPLTKWAIKQTLPSAPKVGLSAHGYRRSLLNWIAENVTCIHAIEFAIQHPGGFAGTADFLGNIAGKGPLIVDWKTSFNKRGELLLIDYCDQLGAYSLGLKHLCGLQAAGGIVVVARRAGPPDIRHLSELELRGAEARFLDRLSDYRSSLGL